MNVLRISVQQSLSVNCVSAAAVAVFQQLAGSLLSSGRLLPYQESVVVDMLHKEVQKSMENQWQMARLETKRCDHAWDNVADLM